MNARAHIRYADYLMGYRGLYEYASPHYYAAIEAINKNPDSYDDAFRRQLERSMQIMHRDGKDGVPLVTSKNFSVFVSGEIEYGYPMPNVADIAGADAPFDRRAQELTDGIAFTDGVLAENVSGIARTQALIAENISGIERTEGLLLDNDEGIAFFEHRVQEEIREKAIWVPRLEELIQLTLMDDARLEQLLITQPGDAGPRVGSRDEPIGGTNPDGTPRTINTAQATNASERRMFQARLPEHDEAIQTSKDKIKEIEEDKANNAETLQIIKDDKVVNEQRVQEFGQDRDNNEAKQAERREELVRNEAFRKQRKRDLAKAHRTFSREVEILFRFGNPKLPNLRLQARETEVEEGFLFFGENGFEHLFDTENTVASGVLAKNFLITPEFTLSLEAEVARRENRVEDPANNNRRVFKERSDQLGFRTELGKKFGFNTARFKLAGLWSDIENNDSDDDEGFRLTSSVRLSVFPPATEIKNDPRFRGQRSRHLEIGTGYVERDFVSSTTPTITESSYTPFVSWEELGLLRGFMDVITVYQATVPDKSPNDSSTLQRVSVIPTMIPIYKLYDQGFWTGHEFTTIGFPLSYTFGKTEFDRVSVGIRLEDRLVTPLRFAFRSRLSATFSHYPEIDLDEWAANLRVKVNFGAQSKFSGTKRSKKRARS